MHSPFLGYANHQSVEEGVWMIGGENDWSGGWHVFKSSHSYFPIVDPKHELKQVPEEKTDDHAGRGCVVKRTISDYLTVNWDRPIRYPSVNISTL